MRRGGNHNTGQMITMKKLLEAGIKKLGFDETFKMVSDMEMQREIRYMELKKISYRDKKISDLLS